MRRLADSSRRGEEKKEKGWEGKRKKDRNAEAGTALILKSTLVGLSARFLLFLRGFSRLSRFSDPAERAPQRATKIHRATGGRVMGMKNAFSSSSLPFCFHPSSPGRRVPSSSPVESPRSRLFAPLRREWKYWENDSTGFRGAFVRRAFNARARPLPWNSYRIHRTSRIKKQKEWFTGSRASLPRSPTERSEKSSATVGIIDPRADRATRPRRGGGGIKNENGEASDYRCLLRLADLLVPSSRGSHGLRGVDRGWATSAVINLNQQMPSRVYTD